MDELHRRLVQLLDHINWHGDELRITGNSLGTQVALGISAKFRTDPEHEEYGTKLQRIALFDHFMSGTSVPYNAGRTLLVPPCEYVNNVVLKNILTGPPDTWPVIENYRSSIITSSELVGCANKNLNRMTVFVEIKPWYYSHAQFPVKHTVGISQYLHCFKWDDRGQMQDGAPSCRMPTPELKALCGRRADNPNCRTYFKQTGGEATTWDYDDTFNSAEWTDSSWSSMASNAAHFLVRNGVNGGINMLWGLVRPVLDEARAVSRSAGFVARTVSRSAGVAAGATSRAARATSHSAGVAAIGAARATSRAARATSRSAGAAARATSRVVRAIPAGVVGRFVPYPIL